LCLSSFLTGFLSQSRVRQRPSDWSWFISDNAFQNFSGYVETIEFAVDIQL
jgi:hypothetical protein